MPQQKGFDIKMLAGISTACFYPQYTEEALKEIASLSVQAVEIFLNCDTEMQEPYLKEVRKLSDANGIRILSVHPFTSGVETMLFFTKYDRRFQEGRDFYKRYYNAANILGADITVFHGCARHYKISRNEYFNRFGILAEDAEKEGVRLCQENVARCKSHSVDFLRDMRGALPNVHFVLDIKQLIRSEEDVDSYVEAMGDRVAHIHISDHNDHEDCLPPGSGVFNISKFLSVMRDKGFEGGVVVELYRDNFDSIVEIQAGYQHVLSAFPQARKITK